MANILSNAVKFTQHGSVTISGTCQKLENDALDVQISVTDTGIGIPSETLESIFDTFDLKGVKTSGKYGGQGLGLPISKGLTELMGGKIRIESNENRGTIVTINIPAELDPFDNSWQPPKGILKDDKSQHTGRLSHDYPHRILVVEDHSINRRILCLFLANMGYEVDEATDGQLAVAAAMKGDYDLIFMDLRMPNMNGIEATRWIRQQCSGRKDLRIVALTGDAMLETRERCLSAGMDDFIAKPIHAKDLEAILRNTAKAA